MTNLIPILLAGGSGSRLWPLSSDNLPKQFYRLGDDYSIFQKTLLRIKSLSKLVGCIPEILILTSEKYRFIVIDQIEEVGLRTKFMIILEPSKKNTAPALTLGALYISENYEPDTRMLVLPCDHLVEDYDSFASLIKYCDKNIQSNDIYLFGIKPLAPKTGFGYVKFSGKRRIKDIVHFVEKPNLSKAKKMINNKNYLWNSGIFFLPYLVWLNCIEKLNNQMLINLRKSFKKKSLDNFFIRPSSINYNKLKANSIDYEVIEKALNLGVSLKIVLINFKWSDLGSYESLENTLLKKKNNNFQTGNIATYNSKNNIVINNSINHLIALNGVKNLIVIATKDAILVSDKSNSESIKLLVDKLSRSALTEAIEYRPWGYFINVYQGDEFKVKKLYLKPHSAISLQTHQYRNEHWVVVNGSAVVTIGNRTLNLKKDESVYITKKTLHRIENKKNIPLELIEVQTGKKILESDIKRYEDIYKRN